MPIQKSLFFVEKDEHVLSIAHKKLYAFMRIPEAATGLVVIAHGSGSSRFSPRDQWIAKQLYKEGLGVFLMDLLTKEEEAVDQVTRELRFDIPFLADRIVEIIDWLKENENTKDLLLGLFGASTGAAAAICAAAKRPEEVKSVVSRGGRPDLAGKALEQIQSPTLLIVGGYDTEVLGLNQQALSLMRCEKKLEIVPGATHLFEESGTLEQVSQLTIDWFLQFLTEE
ncbi:MAG: dienelactone hydrolase family protein [Chlamydiales bacterium]